MRIQPFAVSPVTFARSGARPSSQAAQAAPSSQWGAPHFGQRPRDSYADARLTYLRRQQELELQATLRRSEALTLDELLLLRDATDLSRDLIDVLFVAEGAINHLQQLQTDYHAALSLVGEAQSDYKKQKAAYEKAVRDTQRYEAMPGWLRWLKPSPPAVPDEPEMPVLKVPKRPPDGFSVEGMPLFFRDHRPTPGHRAPHHLDKSAIATLLRQHTPHFSPAELKLAEEAMEVAGIISSRTLYEPDPHGGQPLASGKELRLTPRAYQLLQEYARTQPADEPPVGGNLNVVFENR